MAAPNLKEIEWAIEELKNSESSKANYILMAALRSCREEFMGVSEERPQIASYSHAAAPIPVSAPLDLYGDSEFLQAVEGKDPAGAWAVMDALMSTLQLSYPRAYNRVMREMRGL